jgi:hypothetical protein
VPQDQDADQHLDQNLPVPSLKHSVRSDQLGLRAAWALIVSHIFE